MRHFTLILALAILAISATTCLAAGHPVITTVDEAKASGVDTDVSLTGHIVNKVQGDEYIFSDGTGELLLYIDDASAQQALNNSSNLQVKGRIVRNFMYTEVKAKDVTVRN